MIIAYILKQYLNFHQEKIKEPPWGFLNISTPYPISIYIGIPSVSQLVSNLHNSGSYLCHIYLCDVTSTCVKLPPSEGMILPKKAMWMWWWRLKGLTAQIWSTVCNWHQIPAKKMTGTSRPNLTSDSWNFYSCYLLMEAGAVGPSILFPLPAYKFHIFIFDGNSFFRVFLFPYNSSHCFAPAGVRRTVPQGQEAGLTCCSPALMTEILLMYIWVKCKQNAKCFKPKISRIYVMALNSEVLRVFPWEICNYVSKTMNIWYTVILSNFCQNSIFLSAHISLQSQSIIIHNIYPPPPHIFCLSINLLMLSFPLQNCNAFYFHSYAYFCFSALPHVEHIFVFYLFWSSTSSNKIIKSEPYYSQLNFSSLLLSFYLSSSKLWRVKDEKIKVQGQRRSKRVTGLAQSVAGKEGGETMLRLLLNSLNIKSMYKQIKIHRRQEGEIILCDKLRRIKETRNNLITKEVLMIQRNNKNKIYCEGKS
ncbi:hypothetical protein VP01_682g3 [Puccinia sorghi]|uniref:Uncharacterized protein n=1 Tax=Puccinia sorghi TaxID=27349 RepID=A0A0L6UEE0_9BASI|nr:hypothetical protein VP01_682g3 [Puccinia sorghi]